MIQLTHSQLTIRVTMFKNEAGKVTLNGGLLVLLGKYGRKITYTSHILQISCLILITPYILYIIINNCAFIIAMENICLQGSGHSIISLDYSLCDH